MGNNGEELRNLLGNNSLLCDPESRYYCYLHLLKVRDILGLLTPFSTDCYQTLFPAPHKEKWEKAVWLRETSGLVSSENL